MFANILPMAPKNRSVVALVYEDLCVFEFGVATELFGLRRPELDVDWYDFEVISIDSRPLRAMGTVLIEASRDLDAISSAGTIVIPGWSNRAGAPSPELIERLVGAHDRGARLMSICSGVFLLAATGLLDGKSATTHWRYVEELSELYPQIDVQANVLYVDNGSTLTSAGSAAGIDAGLHLIRRDYGPAIANQVARRMVVPAHRDGGQAQFIQHPVPTHEDATIGPTLDWAREHLHEKLVVRALADHARMSERTFVRRFAEATGTTPHRWLTQTRVHRAQDLLESTSSSIEQVAQLSGFGSAATMRHHFEKELRTTPTAYRRTFATSAMAD